MEDQKYVNLMREIKKIHTTMSSMSEDINRIDRDLADDRRAIEDMRVNQGRIDEKQTSIQSMLTTLRTKLKDAVSDATYEVIEPVKEQLNEFVEKKVLRMNVPQSKPFWKLGWLKGVK